MTDFAARILRPEPSDFPVRSLLDCDFYKFTMGAFILENYPGVRVRFALINREPRIPVALIVPEEELRWALDHVMSLAIRRTDLYYLRGMDVYGRNMFKNDYLDSMARFRLPPYDLRRSADGEQYELCFEGPWEAVTYWETIAMAVIMELYYRNLMRRMPKTEIALMYGAAANKLYRKLRRLKAVPGIRIADFGQRRRHSFLWQQFAIEMAMEVLGPEQFTGTSNTYFAFQKDLIPVGTNAHELPMVVTALKKAEADGAEEVRRAQYQILRQWAAMYGKGLRIVLPDTYGSDQFFAGMPADMAREVAHEWRGMRQDSGDPAEECRKFVAWLRSQGVADPKAAGKACIFSDGLDVKLDGYGSVSDAADIVELYQTFADHIHTPFGWGTNFTNDFRGCLPDPEGLVPGLEAKGLSWRDVFKGFSLVCKVVAADSWPAVKLSNNIRKATGAPEEVARYAGIFGDNGRIEQACLV